MGASTFPVAEFQSQLNNNGVMVFSPEALAEVATEQRRLQMLLTGSVERERQAERFRVEHTATCFYDRSCAMKSPCLTSQRM